MLGYVYGKGYCDDGSLDFSFVINLKKKKWRTVTYICFFPKIVIAIEQNKLNGLHKLCVLARHKAYSTNNNDDDIGLNSFYASLFFLLFILNGSQITRNQSQNIRYDCARAIVYVIRRLKRQKIKYEWINVWPKKKKLWQLTERESEHATNAVYFIRPFFLLSIPQNLHCSVHIFPEAYTSSAQGNIDTMTAP